MPLNAAKTSVKWRTIIIMFHNYCIAFICIVFYALGLSWSHDSWIYNYPCLSPLKLWVSIPLTESVLDTGLCDRDCQWIATGHWFFSENSGFLHQWKWPPRYSWNIVENWLLRVCPFACLFLSAFELCGGSYSILCYLYLFT